MIQYQWLVILVLFFSSLLCTYKHRFITISLTACIISWFFIFVYQPTLSPDKPNKQNFIDDNDVSIYKTKRTISTSLFTAATRPQHIQLLYEKAAPTPVVLVYNGGSDTNSENNFSACPLSFGHTRRQITKNIDADIETRMVRTERCCSIFLTRMLIRSIETNNVRLINNWGKAFLLLSFGLCRLFSALSPSGIHSQNFSIITAGCYWRAPKMDINRSNWWNNGWSKLLGQSWNQFSA